MGSRWGSYGIRMRCWFLFDWTPLVSILLYSYSIGPHLCQGARWRILFVNRTQTKFPRSLANLPQVALRLEPSTAWDPLPRPPVMGATSKTQHCLRSLATLACGGAAAKTQHCLGSLATLACTAAATSAAYDLS